MITSLVAEVGKKNRMTQVSNFRQQQLQWFQHETAVTVKSCQIKSVKKLVFVCVDKFVFLMRLRDDNCFIGS
jgi:hypothetical protein